MAKHHLIIGISGASGAIYGIRLLEMLKTLPDIHTHLVISKAGRITIAQETAMSVKQVEALADETHNIMDIGASIASGSHRTLGMVVAPCSMHTLAEIATAMSGNLLTRAADVVLKEQRKLVLMVRESPFHAIHLQHMARLAELGVVIAPPVPAFYHHPKSLDDVVSYTCARTLDMFGIEVNMQRWQGLNALGSMSEA